jgi:hypothetical protein
MIANRYRIEFFAIKSRAQAHAVFAFIVLTEKSPADIKPKGWTVLRPRA